LINAQAAPEQVDKDGDRHTICAIHAKILIKRLSGSGWMRD
jgi:hypothetical protein